MVDRWANIISYKIYKEQLFNHVQIREIRYGLQVFLSELIKTFIIILLFCLAGILHYGLFVIAVFAFTRIFAGGYHATTYFRCFIISLLILTASIICGLYVQSNFVFCFLFLFSLVITSIFAPVDHKNKPIISQIRRRKFKIISIFLVLFWNILFLYLPLEYKFIGSFALSFQIASLLSCKNIKCFLAQIKPPL